MTTKSNQIIDKFQELDLKKPADLIIEQIKNLISEGSLKPEDRLPSERAFSDQFGVGRGHVREALKKLEFYGIIKTIPHRGTVVSELGVAALEGLISNMLGFRKDDIDSFLETRSILEINSARLAAERVSKSDIVELTNVHKAFSQKVENEDPGISEDHLFHLKIAELSKNTLLRTLIALITPDIFTTSINRDGRAKEAMKEHERILQAIEQKNPHKAAKAMKKHMKMSLGKLRK